MHVAQRVRWRRFFLVHGEEKQCYTLAESLRNDGFSDVTVPSKNDIFEFWFFVKVHLL